MTDKRYQSYKFGVVRDSSIRNYGSVQYNKSDNISREEIVDFDKISGLTLNELKATGRYKIVLNYSLVFIIYDEIKYHQESTDKDIYESTIRFSITLNSVDFDNYGEEIIANVLCDKISKISPSRLTQANQLRVKFFLEEYDRKNTTTEDDDIEIDTYQSSNYKYGLLINPRKNELSISDKESIDNEEHKPIIVKATKIIDFEKISGLSYRELKDYNGIVDDNYIVFLMYDYIPHLDYISIEPHIRYNIGLTIDKAFDKLPVESRICDFLLMAIEAHGLDDENERRALAFLEKYRFGGSAKKLQKHIKG